MYCNFVDNFDRIFCSIYIFETIISKREKREEKGI